MFGSFTVTAALWHVTVRRAEPRSERRPPPHTADSERVWFEVNPIKGQGLQKYKTLGSPDFGTLPNTPRWAERWMRWSYRSALPQTQPCDFIQVRGRGWRGESSLQSQQTRRWRATDTVHTLNIYRRSNENQVINVFLRLFSHYTKTKVSSEDSVYVKISTKIFINWPNPAEPLYPFLDVLTWFTH